MIPLFNRLRNIGRFIKALISLILDTCIIWGIKCNDYHEGVLLVKVDTIGDYCLFREFIPSISRFFRLQGKKITLCGNVAWKDLTETFDKRFFDDFIWIDSRKFNHISTYRFRKLRELASQGFDSIVNPTFSRAFFIDDTIVHTITSKEKIGNKGDKSNSVIFLGKIASRYYSKLFPASSNIFRS